MVGHHIADRLNRNIDSEGEKTNADQTERDKLVPFPLVLVRIDRHPPQQCCTRSHFDETINAKRGERNTSCDETRRNGSDSFHRVPTDGEIFEPLAASSNVQAFRPGVRHAVRINEFAIPVTLVDQRRNVARCGTSWSKARDNFY